MVFHSHVTLSQTHGLFELDNQGYDKKDKESELLTILCVC